ncbi:MFS transporter [Nonomuraea sp. NPDC050328]|uniref:MFS transporter n=1 Tax=Nonomuraea sp. NPDC050328 TaxID=3364361 RepID=UPI003791D78F
MRATLAQARSFNRPVRLLLVNQLTINTGFYLLMPYLAGHLSGGLGLAAWLVALVLGVRNLSQQGLFLLGGSLADRLGYKPMILSGLALRTAGFALLGLAESLPLLLLASALTGLAGALFNPAARAYLAVEAGERKVEAFALFNVFYQAGILLGPPLGLLLSGAGFRTACLVAAALFALLAVAQARALPVRRGGPAAQSMWRDWREVLGNRRFLGFALVMSGSYVLGFQVYLALPLEMARSGGGQLGVTLLFVLSGVLTIAGQVRITAWAKARWSARQAMARGLTVMGVAFAPPALLPGSPVALAGCAALLTLGTMIVYPFEMGTITTLGGERLVGTYYGCYSSIAGLGIAGGNVLTGLAFDARPSWAWGGLAVLGVGCAWGLSRSCPAGGGGPPGAPPSPGT